MKRFRFILTAFAALWAGASAFANSGAAYSHYMKALLLQHQGNYAQALEEYKAAADLDPQSLFVMEQAAELSLETGQADQAVDWAKRLVALDPKRPQSWVLMGNIRWARGEQPEAQKAFEQALQLDPKYGEAMFALGNLLNAQAPEKARHYFETYLRSNPEHAAEAHYQIATVDERRGHHESAVAHLKEAIGAEPNFMQARYTLAHLYELRRDTDSALSEYLGILEREPDNVPLFNHVGEIYFAKEQMEQAESYFNRAKALQPHNSTSCLWLAILAEQKGDFSAAANALSDSSALSEEADISLRLSYYLSQANRLKEAMAVLEKAHTHWPENNEIAYFLALGYDDAKDDDKAIVILQEILKRAPDFRDAQFQLGAIYEKKNRIDDAEREFRALLKAHPSDATALNYLGYSLVDRGLKVQEGEDLIRRAISIEPRNGAYRDSLGWAEFKQAHYPQAMEELKHAVELLPDDSTVWDHVGDVYKVFGDTVAAWRAWKTGLSYDPANEKISKKISAAESAFSPEQLGGHLMDFLGGSQGGISRYTGMCDMTGVVGKKTFSFKCLLTFKAPNELSLELLGPMMVPIFHASLTEDQNFAMDAVSLPGLSPEAVRDSLFQSLGTLRDYFMGRVFSDRPAQYHKGWRSRWVSTPTRQLFLDDSRSRLNGVRRPDGAGVKMTLDNFRSDQNHQIPDFMKLEGKDFSLSLHIPSPNLQFDKTPAVP